MAALNTVDAFRLRLNLKDLDEINEKAAAALEAATFYLSSYLQTGFDRLSYEETFWINPRDLEPLHDRFIRLRLNHGFVHVDPTATPDPIETKLYISNLHQDLPGEEIGSSVWRTDLTKGLIFVSNEDPDVTTTNFWRAYRDAFYMQVTYTAGFDTKATANGRVYKSVPSWLAEAALRVGINTYNLSSCKGDKAAKCDCMGNDVRTLLDPYVRHYPQAADPIELAG